MPHSKLPSPLFGLAIKNAPSVMGAALSCSLLTSLSLFAKEPVAADSADELFGFSKISNALFTFSPEDWKAIKPEEPVRPGGPGGPGRPGNFGPGGMMAPLILQQFDTDKDSALTREEFTAGFGRWFQAWDTKQTGSLDGDAVRDGMNKDLNPMARPAPGAGASPGGTDGPRPPGPGGPMGRGLQAQEGKRNGISGMTGINFEYVHADLEFAGERFADVAVRYKGNGTYGDSRDSDKKSFKVDLNKFVKGQKLSGLTKLNFHNNITDAAWMNESLAYTLYREAGVPAPRSSYTRLAVTVPGAFDRHSLGLYTFVENPDTNWAKANFSSKKGLILKPSTRELFVDKGTDWSAYKQAYDAKTDITDEQVRRVVEFAGLITNASDEELAASLPDFLDIDEFSRFLAVTVWLSSTDSILMMGQNYVVYLHPKTDKFLFIPWDLDRAFGNFFTPQPEELSIRKAWGADNRFLTRVMQVPAVRDAYLARLAEFQDTFFRPEALNRRIDEMAKLIRPAVAEEGAEKLALFDRALREEDAANVAAPDQPGPLGFRMGGRRIKAFIKARHQSVADQLAGKSEGKGMDQGRGPGGPRGGIGNFLAPVFIKAADADANGQVASAEFHTLAERWFGEWDAASTGKLDAEKLREGLSKVFPPPRFGGPPPSAGPGTP